MYNTKFGIEIEFTGITRTEAAQIAAAHLGGTHHTSYDSYNTQTITAPDGREWKFMRDASITCQRKMDGRKVSAGDEYSVELVSPILTYREDIETLQELVRKLRKAGAFTNGRCGIHIHLDGAAHTPRSIRNFVNIIASKNDLFYKALQIEPGRMEYCKKMDEYMVRTMNKRRPRTFKQIEDIWYDGYDWESRNTHYHQSRYHFLNLHSFFTRHHTVELRGFNSELHAGKKPGLHRPRPGAQQSGAYPAQRQQPQAAGRKRKVRHAHLPEPDWLHRRGVQELPGAPIQAPFRFGGMAVPLGINPAATGGEPAPCGPAGAKAEGSYRLRSSSRHRANLAATRKEQRSQRYEEQGKPNLCRVWQ